jgi:hypothetical protein
MIESYPTDDLSNIKCCVSFVSNRDAILCSLGGGHQYWNNEVESLVYHLLQSVNVYVGDLFFFFKGYPLSNFRRKLHYFRSKIWILRYDLER